MFTGSRLSVSISFIVWRVERCDGNQVVPYLRQRTLKIEILNMRKSYTEYFPLVDDDAGLNHLQRSPSVY